MALQELPGITAATCPVAKVMGPLLQRAEVVGLSLEMTPQPQPLSADSLPGRSCLPVLGSLPTGVPGNSLLMALPRCSVNVLSLPPQKRSARPFTFGTVDVGRCHLSADFDSRSIFQ